MIALNDLIAEIEKTKTKNSVFEENPNVIVEKLPEVKLSVKNECSVIKKKNKILQLKKYLTQKEILGKKICTVSLVAS